MKSIPTIVKGEYYSLAPELRGSIGKKYMQIFITICASILTLLTLVLLPIYLFVSSNNLSLKIIFLLMIYPILLIILFLIILRFPYKRNYFCITKNQIIFSNLSSWRPFFSPVTIISREKSLSFQYDPKTSLMEITNKHYKYLIDFYGINPTKLHSILTLLPKSDSK